MTFFQSHRKQVLSLITPVFFIIAGLIMLRFIAENPEQAEMMARGIAGPTTWPKFMLYGVIFFSAAWLMLDVRLVHQHYRAHKNQPSLERTLGSAPGTPIADPSQSNDVKIWIGLAIIIGYGFLIPLLGFTIATFLYFIVWMLLGGIRKPIFISLVSVLGTIAMLYIFIKLALMPLDRGQGMFNEITLSIYRFLKIF